MRGPSIRSWIVAMIVGGGLAWLMDPQAGNRRRSLLAGKLNSLMNRGSRSAGASSRQVADRAQGVLVESVPHSRDNPDPDDTTLKDRVESEAFRDTPVLRGKMNVNVAGGIVELRGELDSQAEIDQVVAAVRAVPDVRDIHNYLHLPGTPAPNKEEALKASR